MEESDAPRFTFALKRGAMLAARYRIDRLLADSSSFALTYLATDTSPTDGAPPTVAIKEFLPRVLVGRGRDGCTVQPHSPADGREFGKALRRFVHEAQVLGDIESPYLMRVHGCLEENGTAYLMMAPRQSRPLPAAIADLGGAMTAADAVGFVLRLLNPLEQMHAEGVVHRGISPDVVSVTDSWEPTLYGFSARRHVASEAAEIVPGFSALEQYGSGDVGPWTDVYACSAILYYLVTGVAPPAAIERATGKALAPVSWLAPDVSAELSQVIARGLSLMADQRPHAATELRKQLEASLTEADASLPFAYQEAESAIAASHEGVHASLDAAAHEHEQDATGDADARPPIARWLGDVATRIRDGLRPVAARLRIPREPRADAPAEDETPSTQVPSIFKPVEVENKAWEITAARGSSSIRYPAAAALIVAVVGSTYWVVANRLNADLKPGGLGSAQMRTATADSRTTTTSVSAGATGLRAPNSTGPLQQGTLLGGESSTKTRRSGGESATQADANAAALPTIKRMNLTAPLDAEKKIVPVDVVLDLRTQLTNGREQAEQGQYALARRIFASALTAADMALDRFSGAESVRSLRTELDSANRRALRACQAENDLTRKRGGTVVPCE